jgi:hypothetical protein
MQDGRAKKCKAAERKLNQKRKTAGQKNARRFLACVQEVASGLRVDLDMHLVKA